MRFFKKYYPDTDFEQGGEVKVLCPFHTDTNPSASINTDKNTFYCFVCGKGYGEKDFVKALNKYDEQTIEEVFAKLEQLESNNTTDIGRLWSDEDMLKDVVGMFENREKISELRLGKEVINNIKVLTIPYYKNNILLQNVKYNLYKDKNLPKVLIDEKGKSGLVFPYDLWDKNDKTYIMEGEKDCILAQCLGLNAICISGGAGALINNDYLEDFKGLDVIIVYDNDKAGKQGIQRLTNQLYQIAKSIKYIDIGEITDNKDKADFYDYIKDYNGTTFEFMVLDLKQMEVQKEKIKHTPLSVMLKNNIINRDLQSIITVTSEYGDTYSFPSFVKAVKKETNARNDTMTYGEIRTWTQNDDNLHKILELTEIKASNSEIDKKLRELMFIPQREGGIQFEFRVPKTVYHTFISDVTLDGTPVAVEAYALKKMEIGKQYVIKHRIVPHPNKNQRLVSVIMDVEEMNSYSEFKLDKHILKQFQVGKTIDEKLQIQYELMKHHTAKHLKFNLWLMLDLVFHSILDFEYDEKMKGALDVFVLGDTTTGKSSTSSALVKLYNYGQFLSLKTSTTVGLIGGSTTVGGSWCNTIGAIPRQHGKLVVLEEFSGAKADFIKTMTDVRSSNELRLARASGELKVPCKVRMITISNPINDQNGNPRFLSSFPNGIAPICELVTSAEDIARYDGFILVPKVEERFDPFKTSLKGQPLPVEYYQHKMAWVTTRKVENVIMSDEIKSYIWKKAEYLNNLFECNFALFGVTTPKKLVRFCVALASLLVNTDETYENIIVTKEIVDYMTKFLEDNYKSTTFRLDLYKQEWDSYNVSNTKDIEELQRLYPNNSILFDNLIKTNSMSRLALKTVSGLDGDSFNPLFNKIVSLKFVRMIHDNIYPTNKFRLTYEKIDKTFTNNTGEFISLD